MKNFIQNSENFKILAHLKFFGRYPRFMQTIPGFRKIILFIIFILYTVFEILGKIPSLRNLTNFLHCCSIFMIFPESLQFRLILFRFCQSFTIIIFDKMQCLIKSLCLFPKSLRHQHISNRFRCIRDKLHVRFPRNCSPPKKVNSSFTLIFA